MATQTPNPDIPSDIQSLLEIFEASLAEVRFPDVDLGTLRALVADVEARATEVARLDEQVRVARQALDDAQGELRKAARRGLAYARVYAEDNPALSGALEGVSLDDARRREREPKKPGRKRRGPGKGAAERADGPEAGQKVTAELPFAEAKSEAA